MSEEKEYKIIPTMAYKRTNDVTKRTLTGILDSIFEYNPSLDIPRVHNLGYYRHDKNGKCTNVDFCNFVLTGRQLRAMRFTGGKLNSTDTMNFEIGVSENISLETADKLKEVDKIIQSISNNSYPDLNRKGTFKFYWHSKVYKIETSLKNAMLISAGLKTDNIGFELENKIKPNPNFYTNEAPERGERV